MPLDISEDSAFLEPEADGHEQPEEAFENEERRRELIALVDTLPQSYREVVSLHYFEDLSYQEIADIFNQPGRCACLLCSNWRCWRNMHH